MESSKEPRYIIFIDTGGTFSDSIIVQDDGTYVSGKSATTPDNLMECFFNCIEAGAEKMGKSLREILSNTALLGFGTTAGTNALITRVGGPKLGLITTRGFEDTTILMRGDGRAPGLSPVEAMHIVGTDKPEPLIPRKLIKGVTERVDSLGHAVIPLYEEEVKNAVKELLKEKVEGIAVSLLWSFLNPVHEQRIKEIIKDLSPGMPVSVSSDISSLMREFQRYNSTIMNLFIAKPVQKLFSQVKGRLKEEGFTRPLQVMQAAGGVSRSEVVKPISTLHSGPVGGLLGVNYFKKLYGYKNGVGSDVGGTSFDISVVPEGGAEYLKQPKVGRFYMGNPMLEIISIGAGGGTIAYLDGITGTLRVGPQSSGATPGPVCYDQGGTLPTITDADVIMNRVDPDYFLGGKKKLNKKKAIAAMKEKIADPLNMSVEEASFAICNIVDNVMGDTLTSLIRERGLVSENFALFAFGGAGPVHCAGYSYGKHFQKVIVPGTASTFSAFGASSADVLHRDEKTIIIVIPKLNYDLITHKFRITSLDEMPQESRERFNHTFKDMIDKASLEMEEEGFKKNEVNFNYIIEMRYGGQLDEVRFTSPCGEINSTEDWQSIIEAFENEYERLYTSGAMYPEGGVELVTVTLEATASLIKPRMVKHDHVGKDPSKARKSTRDVYFEGGFHSSHIYEMSRLNCGNLVEGPAIIEGTDTALVVPPTHRVMIDEYLNMQLETK